MAGNPFRPAEQVAPKVKALVFGQSGAGKTYLGLTAPGKIAVIDTEGGTAFYAGRKGLSDFDVLPTKTFHDVTSAIGYLREHPTEYQTLVIDPVTVLYETLQDAAQLRRAEKRRNPDADLEMLDWQQIKRAYKTLMTDLVNLPMHVIVIARERDDTERRGNDSVKVGVRPDAEKSTEYYFDAVIRLVLRDGTRTAEVRKDRTGTLPPVIEDPSFQSLFKDAIKANRKGTGERGVQSDDDAAQRDSETTFADAAAMPRSEDGGLIGKVATQGTQDFEIRPAPDGGASLPFRLREGRASVIVLAHDQLAEALYLLRESVLGQRVTAWGHFTTETARKAGEPDRDYAVFHIERIQTPDGMLPSVSPLREDEKGWSKADLHNRAGEHPELEPDEPEPIAPGQESFDMGAVDAELVLAAADGPRGGVDHDLSDA